jgi:uncharacterized protein
MEPVGIHIIQEHVLQLLAGLSPALTYHSAAHTIDVLTQSKRIGRDEGINERDLYRLEIAALYHDTGFLERYKHHEEKSCEYLLADAQRFRLFETDIHVIQQLIMATRMPQQPANHLQRVICDADLDYLGRKDFHEISELLKKEFIQYGIVKDVQEFKDLQEKFLRSHHYHTATSKLLRNAGKEKNIELFVDTVFS